MSSNAKLLPWLVLAATAAAQHWRGKECTPSFRLNQESYVQVASLGWKTDNANLQDLLRPNLYLYVGDIGDAWPKKPLRLTVFFGDPLQWKSSGRMREKTFQARAKAEALNPWSVPIQQKGQSLQFQFQGISYRVRVTAVETTGGPAKGQVLLELCEVR